MFKFSDAEANQVLEHYNWDEVKAIAVYFRSRQWDSFPGVAAIISSNFKLRFEMLALLRQKIKRNMKFYQPYPTKLVIEGEKKRDCWWKVKFNSFTEEMLTILFPDRDLYYLIQPKKSYRPKSTVTMYKVTEFQFEITLGVARDILNTTVVHLGQIYKVMLSDFIIVKHSKKTGIFEVIYKLEISTSDGIKVEPQIQPRYLRLGRPKN